jgi:hypothetical protein
MMVLYVQCHGEDEGDVRGISGDSGRGEAREGR